MPTTETRRLSPALLWGIFLAAILAVFVVFRASTREEVQIRVAAVGRQNLLSSVSTNGKVEPIEQFQAYAPTPGTVAKVYVVVGQQIKKNDLLMKLDDADAVARLATAHATRSTAEANLQDINQGGSQDERTILNGDINRLKLQKQHAENDLAALQQLQKQGAASAGEVTAAQQHLQTVSSSLDNLESRSRQRYSPADRARAEAQVVDANAAIASAQSSFAGQNIRAPIPGTVYSIPVSTYDYVQSGENLLDLADLNRIQVRAYFDEPEIGKLAVGQPVKIAWDAKPNRVWHGHISRAPSSVITYGTRNVGECLITVDDARGELLPNTNVVVTVTTSQRFNVLSVPREALHTDGGDFVYRVAAGKLVRTPIQVGVVNLTRVEILSGLTDKDTVALNAANNRELSNGLPVKVIE